ncbi:MAG: lamin tail domain-containing protein [Bacteroidota bacterium]|nr:lamin tail domain-containing protein [Bacteroidota bacterium]
MLFSQISSSFDGDFQKNGLIWQGDTNSFIHDNGELRTNHSTLNSTFFISTPSIKFDFNQWEIDVRIAFNPSSANYIDFFIMSDSQQINLAKNGFFVRMGNTQDEISLYRLQNGIETKVIDGVDGILNTSNNHYRLLIEQHQDSLVLKRKKITDKNYFTEGFFKNSQTVNNPFVALRIRQSTASFINRHYFDNLYAGPLIKDTISPKIDSLNILNSNTIRCVLNEACDSFSLMQLNNFIVVSRLQNPDFIQFVNSKTIELQFLTPFDFNTFYQLKILGIKDLNENEIQETILDFILFKPDTPKMFDILITELMIDPDPPVGLVNKEYVELTNVSGRFLDLKNCMISDLTSSKPLPPIIFYPDSILVLYDIPSLNNSADDIQLYNQLGNWIHRVSYTDKWYKDDVKRKGGYSLEMIDYNYPCLNEPNWKASIDAKGGTPGKINSVKSNLPQDTVGVIIQRFEIENDTIMSLYFNKSFDSLSINQFQIFINNLPINYKILKFDVKESVLVISVDFLADKTLEYTINIKGLRDCEGNIQNQIVNWQWISEAKRNDIIINEVLFNPKVGGKDFIEFYNTTKFAFDLSKYFIADVDNNGMLNNYFKISNSIQILKPGQFLVLTEDTNNICITYRCNNLKALKINMTKLISMPDDQGKVVLVSSLDQVIDSLSYHKDWHTPLLRDQNGVSLERLDKKTPTNQPLNWYSAASLAGFATPGYENSQKLGQIKSENYFYLDSKTLSPDGDGFEDFLILNYNLPSSDYALTMNIYNTEGVLIKKVVNNQTIGSDGFVTWDGTDYNQQKLPVGIYIIEIVAVSINSKQVIKQKISCVIAQRF